MEMAQRRLIQLPSCAVHLLAWVHAFSPLTGSLHVWNNNGDCTEKKNMSALFNLMWKV